MKSKTEFLNEDNKKATAIYGYAKITYQQALAAGLKFYWPGEECSRGHFTWARVNNKYCRTCSLEDASVQNGHIPHVDPNLSKKRDLSHELELKRIEKEIYDF